ncbi:hypothetical protein GL218_06523 [Daldinia childiae]|uniref:uncharacterized protein n=1 Tax=Daldinia childiae TaxID=326645 RepID=UPI001446283B|nr:uncharacterized protein GL218_06523 [Daldinia childiae]KAF3056477.1 hypothetical protein GL218_06523 [Daldinia childiae]
MFDSSSERSMDDYIIIRISPPSSPPLGAVDCPIDDELKKRVLKSNKKPEETPDQEPEQELEQQALSLEVTNHASQTIAKKPKSKFEEPVTMGLLDEEQELEEA